MPQVRYLRIRFANNIFPYEIPYFRAAVIEKTQRESVHFHNHNGDEGFVYRYPLIQYKVTNRKASIICLNDGTDEIHNLLGRKDLDLQIGTRSESYAIEDVAMHYFNVQVWRQPFQYALLNWMPLNQKNYRDWQALEGNEAAQAAMLQRILRGHILAFATGVDWRVPEEVKADITVIKEMKLLPYKGQDVLTVTLNFTCNVSLPDYIGLGKGSSVGFGIVKRIKKHFYEHEEE